MRAAIKNKNKIAGVNRSKQFSQNKLSGLQNLIWRNCEYVETVCVTHIPTSPADRFLGTAQQHSAPIPTNHTDSKAVCRAITNVWLMLGEH